MYWSSRIQTSKAGDELYSDTSPQVVLPFGHGLFRATRIEALPPNLNLTLTVLYTTIT